MPLPAGEVVVRQLEERTAEGCAALRGCGTYLDATAADIVHHRDARVVDEAETIIERVVGEGIGIVRRKDIAGEGERAVAEPELRQERRREVGLRHQRIDDTGRAHCTTDPEQRDVVHSRAIAIVRAELRIAVICHTDDEEVLPLRGRLETSNEAPQRLIKVGKGIRHGRRQALVRHVKRLVTAEREHRLVPRAIRRHTDDLIIEDIEGRAVRHTPVRPRETTRERVVVGDLLVARAEEVALHAGEVRIASVEEARRIARLTQAPCDGGQGTTLRRELHHRVCGEARVAAEDRDEPAVGAVAIGIAAREEDTLTSQAIEVRADLGLLAQDTRIASAVALEDEEDDIRPASREERITLKGLGGEEVFGQLTERLLIEGIILGIIVFGLPERGEEAEERIDGSVIEVLAVTEVDLSDIGCRLTHAPTDHEEGRA